jgi:hypothetical protein
MRNISRWQAGFRGLKESIRKEGIRMAPARAA